MKIQKGQTLFELVIALAVVVLVITGIVKAVTTAIKNSTFAKNKSEATRYAQEATEWFKTERDRISWSSFTINADGRTSTACMPALSWPAVSFCDTDNESHKVAGTVFFREIKFSGSGTSRDVSVEVFWLDSTTKHTSKIETRVTNWRETQ